MAPSELHPATPDNGLPEWLSKGPQSDRVEQVWELMGHLAATPDMMALRRQALANAAQAAELPVQTVGVARRWLGWSATMGGALAAALTLAVMAGWFRPAEPAAQTFETRSGERKVIDLADGSTITLDQDTRIAVSYAEDARRIELQRGQAEFAVAKDTARPFSVYSAGRRVVATGTLFNVDTGAHRLVVSLVHGSVVVAQAGDKAAIPHGIRLGPMEQLELDRTSGVLRKGRFDAVNVEAWKSGKLVFRVEPLGQALERVNRYAVNKLRLEAPEASQLPISGVFDVGDSTAFAEAVAAQWPIRTRQEKDAIVLLVR